NAHVFIRAGDVGLTGTEAAAAIDRDAGLRALLERIRAAGAGRMGMIDETGRSAEDSPATPLLAMISGPQTYRDDLRDQEIGAAGVDVVSRLMFMQQAHKTYAGTSTACTGVAAKIAGTVVHECARVSEGAQLRIGHPAGVIETEAVVEAGDGGFLV